MESVIILAGLIVMSVIDIKKKINSYWHADSYGCYCGGHKSSTECMWNSKA